MCNSLSDSSSHDLTGRTLKGYLRLPGLVEPFLVNSTAVVPGSLAALHHHGAADGVEAGGVPGGVHGDSRQGEASIGPPGELWLGVPAHGLTPQHQTAAVGAFLQGDGSGGHGTWR